jgi:hypothetical protein
MRLTISSWAGMLPRSSSSLGLGDLANGLADLPQVRQGLHVGEEDDLGLELADRIHERFDGVLLDVEDLQVRIGLEGPQDAGQDDVRRAEHEECDPRGIHGGGGLLFVHACLVPFGRFGWRHGFDPRFARIIDNRRRLVKQGG